MAILILGATGKVGRRVAHLIGAEARPVSRSSADRFDWDEPATWEPLLEDVTAAYVVPPTLRLDYSAVPEFVGLARSVGVRRLVLLSSRDVDKGLAHETAVQESGMEWTILRPAWFAQNFSEGFLLPGVLAGTVAVPAGQGLVPFTDADDVAAVAAATLTEGGHDERVYMLSGPRALSFGNAVTAIADATGRAITYVDAEPDQFRQGLLDRGMQPDYAGLMNRLFADVREGRENYHSDGVEQVLGREPRQFQDFVQAAAKSGAWQ